MASFQHNMDKLLEECQIILGFIVAIIDRTKT